jgi:hypothetical protein
MRPFRNQTQILSQNINFLELLELLHRFQIVYIYRIVMVPLHATTQSYERKDDEHAHKVNEHETRGNELVFIPRQDVTFL